MSLSFPATRWSLIGRLGETPETTSILLDHGVRAGVAGELVRRVCSAAFGMVDAGVRDPPAAARFR